MYPEAVDVTALWTAIETAAEQAGIAVYVARIDTQPAGILYASPRAAEILGRSQAELIGVAPWSIMVPADQPKIQAMIARPPGAPPSLMRATAIRPDGRRVPIDVAATRIHTAGAVLTFGYFRDVTAELDALSALRESEARFRFLVTASPDGVVILQRGVVVFTNPRAVQLLGAATEAEVMGKSITSFLPPTDIGAAEKRVATMARTGEEMPPREFGVLAVPGRVVEVKSIVCEWEGAPALLALARDVTERAAMQRRLVEADRLAALGTLAAGVAHEINNPMTYALLAVQRIERTLTSLGGPPEALASIREQLSDIEHGIGRVASITRSLRAFARPDDSPPGPVDLTEIVRRSLKMVDNDLRHRAKLDLDLPEVPPVTGNASRLEQVVVNLLLNAIQALPEAEANTIGVRLEAPSKGSIVLSISDNGHGIPAAVRHRIFEPFFTTRPIGKGMGLGLSVCKTIVEGFGGEIAVASTEGVGTTVSITLRVHTGPAVGEQPASSFARAPRLRVLLIDDEPILRTVFARLLEDHHDVVTASSGVDGLELAITGAFDAIVCDVMMPGVDGAEVYRRVALARPGQEKRIIFITGGTFTRELDEFLATTPNRLLLKPFKLEAVLSAVESVASIPLG
ncbi:MAG: Sensory box histidine kinase/response regulator [Myxococcales bacterium]|nr:Sensory box histidine kinase/response regulator [Myxococcales bacterium]